MTGLRSNINELIQKFELLKSNVEGVDFAEALLVGVNVSKAMMQNRIFNQGKDKFGVTLGTYKGKKFLGLSQKALKQLFKTQKTQERTVGQQKNFTPYELKRVQRGRQIRYKDLEFTGDLRRGIKVLKERNRVVCAIPNNQLFVISKYQEEQLDTVIFAQSEQEKKAMIDNTNAALKQIYDRLFSIK